MKRPNLRKLLNPRFILGGLAITAGGLILHNINQRFVPNVWARWGISAISALMGFWFPLTKQVLAVTHLDDDLDQIAK